MIPTEKEAEIALEVEVQLLEVEVDQEVPIIERTLNKK
jgi:hypothetical protein